MPGTAFARHAAPAIGLPAHAARTSQPERGPDARLKWLVAYHAWDESRRRLFRRPQDERAVELMRRPVETRQAFALFGALLGTFPPAAIFYQMFGSQLLRAEGEWALFALTLGMNVVCALAGWRAGAACGAKIDDFEVRGWHATLLGAAALGAGWGMAAGGAGGLVFFGFGAFFGAAFAVPIGIIGFVTFALLHRLVARGGMIDARQLWPLAWGVAATTAAAILGLDG